MRPTAVLLGIVFGSTLALAVCLSMTWVVYQLLPEYSAQLAGEKLPLLRGLAWSWALTAASAGGFVGELRTRPWRWSFDAALVLLLSALSWQYWPK